MNLVTNFLLIIVLVCSSEYQFAFANTDVRCVTRERKALLKFKEGLVDDGVMSSWGKVKECCKWEGVRCSNTTGRVIALQLVGQYWSSGNHYLGGEINSALSELHSLNVLDLSGNYFRANKFPKFICSMTQLQHLNLSHSNLLGNLPSKLWNLINLETLDLSENRFSGTIPPQIGSLSNLETLHLSDNTFSGTLPSEIGNFTNLTYFNLSHNQLTGTLTDFSSMDIQYLDVSSNKFSGPIPLISPSTRLFLMSQNMLSGSLSFICGIPYALEVLDLSDNQLSGKLPNCWGNITDLETLSLATNHFSGEIPHSLGSLSNLIILHLSNNNFSGELPSALKNCKLLQFINIGDNRLTGSVPTWIGGYHQTMSYLIIRNNKFYGSISPKTCHLSQIQVLDFSGNNISGHIPPCFQNFTYFVENNISRQNTLYGGGENTKTTIVSWKHKDTICGRNLIFLKMVDLSSNRLDGDIPKSFSSLKGLRSLNLSRNKLTGTIDPDIGHMSSLDSLDLSSNHLSGVIPVSMAKLYSLGVLDLAKNKLSGKIPIGSQLQTFPPSAYEGNIGLCGNPLPPCSEDRPNPSTNNKAQNVDDDDSIMSLSFLKEIGIPIIVGFIFGFWGVVGSLIVKESWRRAFYNFWGSVGDWFYVRVTVPWKKLFSRS